MIQGFRVFSWTSLVIALSFAGAIQAQTPVGQTSRIADAATDARSKVDKYLKQKGETQDLLVLSERETAQVFYDGQGRVRAVSIDYLTSNGRR